VKSLHKLFVLVSLTLASFVAVAVGLSEPAAIRYHDSGCYQADIAKVINRAKAYVLKQVEANQQLPNPRKLAIIFDVDETTLSNYQSMQALHFRPGGKKLRQYLLMGNDPAILPSLELYKLAKTHHVAVFFITGRDELLHHATIINLLKAGYDHWEGMYFRPFHYNKKSIIPFKSSIRRRIEKMGFTIVASIGDQESDYLGGHSARGFKLPNPYYHID
jgi:predicted secreted acid phosphatase